MESIGLDRILILLGAAVALVAAFRYLRLPQNTLYVNGDRVCATLRGLPFEPCFTLTRTGPRSFRGALANFGLSFMYCDFAPGGRVLLARRRGVPRQTTGSIAGPNPVSP